MDPVSVVFILQALLAIADPIIQQGVNRLKNKRSSTISDIRLLLEEALNKKYQENTAKGDKLANQLLRLEAINKSPSLRNAVNKMYDKIKQQIETNNEDILKDEMSNLKANKELDDIEDSPIISTKLKDITKGITKRLKGESNRLKNTENILGKDVVNKYEQKL